MKVIKGIREFQKYVAENRKKADRLHIRWITRQEWIEKKGISMTEIRSFCEELRLVHESGLAADAIKEIKDKKMAIFQCFSYDKDIEEEVKMYEMETGIDIVVFVDEFFHTSKYVR